MWPLIRVFTRQIQYPAIDRSESSFAGSTVTSSPPPFSGICLSKVVNALSEWATVEVVRAGKLNSLSFQRGKTDGDLVTVDAEKSAPGGTTVRFKPDAEVRMRSSIVAIRRPFPEVRQCRLGSRVRFSQYVAGSNADGQEPNNARMQVYITVAFLLYCCLSGRQIDQFGFALGWCISIDDAVPFRTIRGECCHIQRLMPRKFSFTGSRKCEFLRLCSRQLVQFMH